MQSEVPQSGCLVVNADDWGRERQTTDCIRDCAIGGAISCVSAMVFMRDSERAAAVAIEHRIAAGLHLNFTAAFSANGCPQALVERQHRLARHLRRHRLAQAVFHPGLANAFDYVVSAQIDEFRRLYGAEPDRFDGHHHMHLCANVLLPGLLPAGAVVRRSFSFLSGEKSVWNRLYRRGVDRMLARRHRLCDFFFSLAPVDPPGRLERIFSLARRFVVEVETHPVNPVEYRFLADGELLRRAGDVRIARLPMLPRVEPLEKEVSQ